MRPAVSTPSPAREALTASMSCLTVWALEAVYWRLSKHPDPLPLLIQGVLAFTVAAAVLSALGRFLLRRLWSSAVLIFPAATWSAVRVFHHRFDLTSTYALAVAVPAGFIAAALLARIGARRTWLPPLLAVASLALLGAHVVMRERSPAAAVKGRPDVVLIIMDTTRRDHLSVYGYPQQTSPSLEALARDADVYDDAWSVAPWTPASHASMLTGLLPAEHGVDGQLGSPLPANLTTLQGVLRRAGYRTAGFVANPQLSAPGWNREFHEYRPPYRGWHSLMRLIVKWRGGSDSAERILEMAREWWERNPAHPRFVFVNLLEPHNPYAPSAAAYERFLPGVDRREAFAVDHDPASYLLKPGLTPRQAFLLRQLYAAEIYSMDQAIGGFLRWLAARGDLDRTLVVVTADHGERLGERGLVGHDAVMDPHLLRVPLLIRYPPATTAGRIGRRVQLDGLPGYILRVVGVPAPEPMAARALQSQNQSLVVAQYQSPVWLIERLLRLKPEFDADRYRGDSGFAADQRFACFCYSDGRHPEPCRLNDMSADPDWLRDASQAHPEARQRLEAAIRGLPSFRPVREIRPDPALMERLKALGYAN